MLNFFRLSVFVLYSLLCFGVASYAFYYIFQDFNPNNEAAKKFMQAGLHVPIHFLASGLALFLVPFQLSKKLRGKNRQLHKLTGYLYFMAVILGGISGFIMSFDAFGGVLAQWGFRMLAILWLPATIMAVYHAIKGNIQAHKTWIYRSIALTSAAITFRIFLGLGLGPLALPFLTVYVPTTWLCWAINLTIVELIIYTKQPQTIKMNGAFA